MDIGSNIRAIRKQKKITISQLCEGTGLSNVRKHDRTRTLFGKDQLSVDHLSSFGRLRLMIVEMPPGTSTGDHPHAHKGMESHVVLKGSIEARQGEDVAILHEGDSFSWTACVPHMVRNIGDEPAVLMIASYSEEEGG